MKILDFIVAMSHELWDIITHETGFIISGLFGGVFLFFAKHIKKALMNFTNKLKDEDNKFKDHIPTIIHRDMEIYNQLFEYRIRTDADRTSVFQFHNGTYYLNSTAQIKISCTHEIVAVGISRESSKLQDLFISQYTAFISKLMVDSFLVLDKENIDKFAFGLLLRSQGVKTAILTLFKTNETIEGFLISAYLTDIPLDRRIAQKTVSEERRKLDSEGSLIDISQQYASKIGFLLRKR